MVQACVGSYSGACNASTMTFEIPGAEFCLIIRQQENSKPELGDGNYHEIRFGDSSVISFMLIAHFICFFSMCLSIFGLSYIHYYRTVSRPLHVH